MNFKHYFTLLCVLVAIQICVSQNVPNVTDPAGQSGTGSGSQTFQEKSSLQKGMDPFFKLCHNFLQSVMPSNFYDGNTPFNVHTLIKVVNDNNYASIQTNWKDVVKTYGGVAACIIMGIIFIVFMPIVGLIYCCCHCCCHKCGGTKEEKDPPHASCKRWTLVILVAVFSTLILVGGVIIFLGGELLHRSLTEENTGMLGRLDSSLEGVKTFVNDTTEEIVQVAQDKVVQSLDDILPKIKDAANNTVTEIKSSINATSLLKKANDVGIAAQNAKNSLHDIQSALANLTILQEAINKTLINATKNLESACNRSVCDIAIPTFKPDFSKLDKLADKLNSTSEAQNITEFVDQAAEQFDNVSSDVLKNIQTTINDSSSKLNDIKGKLTTEVTKIRNQTDLNTPLSDAQSTIKGMKKTTKVVGDIIWYVCIGMGCAVLLVVAFVYLGLLFGLCGERPGERANCCNRGSAANLLCTSICCMFLFAWILMIVVLVTFAVGGLSYLMACRYIKDGIENVGTFEQVLSDGFKINVSSALGVKNLTIAGMFRSCKENKPVYRALQLQDLFDFDKMVNMSDIFAQVENMTVSGNSVSNITLLSSDLKKQLDAFKDAGLENINFTDYNTQINSSVFDSGTGLPQIIQNIRNVSAYITDTGRQKILNDTADELERLENNELKQLDQEKSRLQNAMTQIEADNQGNKSVSNSIQALIKDIQASQDNFNANKTDIVMENMKKATKSIITLINGTVEKTKHEVTDELGRCRPLYDAAQGVVDAACVTTLDPFNLIWFGLGWSLFFYIPTFICAALLANLYKRRSPYEKERSFDDVGAAPYNGYAGGREERMQLTNMGQGVQNGQKSGMDNRGYQGTDPYYRDNYRAPSDLYSRAGPPSHYEQPYAHKDPYGNDRPPMYDQAMSGGGRRQY